MNELDQLFNLINCRRRSHVSCVASRDERHAVDINNRSVPRYDKVRGPQLAGSRTSGVVVSTTIS